MTTELYYLLLTAILTGLLWIPVVVGYLKYRGPLTPSDYQQTPDTVLPLWVKRAQRAHMNAVENFAPFAAIVIIAHLAQISSPLMVLCTQIYFVTRLLHAIVHIAGIGVLRARTVMFATNVAAFIAYALLLIWHM